MTKIGDKIREMMPGQHTRGETDTTGAGAYEESSAGQGTYGTATGAPTTGYTTGTTGVPGMGGEEGTGYATKTTTTTAATTGTAEATGREGQPICSQQRFTKVEDRPIVVEHVEQVKEHRPYEKEFVVETRPTGVVREMAEGRTTEHLGATERVVSEAKPRSPCD